MVIISMSSTDFRVVMPSFASESLKAKFGARGVRSQRVQRQDEIET
jgi:hypothetical protein